MKWAWADWPELGRIWAGSRRPGLGCIGLGWSPTWFAVSSGWASSPAAGVAESRGCWRERERGKEKERKRRERKEKVGGKERERREKKYLGEKGSGFRVLNFEFIVFSVFRKKFRFIAF